MSTQSNVIVISDPIAAAQEMAIIVAKFMPAPVAIEPPMSVKQAAEWLGVSPGIIRTMVNSDQMPHCRIGDRVLIYKHHLAEWKGGKTQTKMTEADMVAALPKRGSRNGR